MFVIRDAGPDDFDSIWPIAKEFNTVSLPGNEILLRKVLEISRRSFSGDLPPSEREYLFVMTCGEGADAQIIGTSMITAQKGNQRSPHVYFEIEHEQKYSPAFAEWLRQRAEWPEDFDPDRILDYDVIRLRYTFNGPTELGGMFMLPRWRKQRLGTRLSYVRFLFIAAHWHKRWFKSDLLAQLLPDLDGSTSPFYQALGKKFTRITYDEADKYSRLNRRFMLELFPRQSIYVKLLPDSAQAVIGKVGVASQGAAQLLKKIGFIRADKIHPLDGGPHYETTVDKVPLITGCFQVGGMSEEDRDYVFEGLLAVTRETEPFWQCVHAEFYRSIDDPSYIRVARRTLDVLQYTPGDVLWAQPWGRKVEIYSGMSQDDHKLPGSERTS